MLELGEMTEEARKKYIDYDTNLIFKCAVKISLMRIAIEDYGLRNTLEMEEPENDKGEKPVSLRRLPLEQRALIYEFIKRYPKYTNEQLAKVLFKECEFYPQ